VNLACLTILTCSGFDQEIAEKIGADMAERGVKFIRGATPVSLTREESRIRVRFQSDSLGVAEEVFDTVLFAVGRDPCTSELNLAAAGVTSIDAKSVACRPRAFFPSGIAHA
jgi:pyruvate/2-oxoglutarate dehydrogenase complex dihydrolipoamide dehydrogenase (E3) component